MKATRVERPRSGCLGDDTINAMLEGALAEDHARLARSHIGECDVCRQLVSAAIDSGSVSGSRTTMPAARSSWTIAPGRTIAGYRIERLLGEGGMGQVFEALHVGLGRKVAIKVLLPELARDQIALSRFDREARLVAALHSQHAVRVYDLGIAESGEPYLVMEMLDGEDLDTVLKRGPASVEQATRWIAEACEAIGEAHALGIVHRDLKPSNLFVTRAGRLVVLDFGLAKLVASNASVTQQGMVLGSPRYMAPEQITGARDVDARADVWSLGATLFHLVTGSSPFHAETIGDTFSRILDGPPPAFERLPPAISPVVRRALARDPAARYANAIELATALRAPPAGLDARFEIFELIGEGGNGAVYRARPRSGGREVALKILRNTVGASRERFAHEAAFVQRLEHPNTVRLLDSGVAADGTPFMAFELVRGRTLAAEISRGPLLPARVARIAIQVLKALGEAHAHGIVHRDVTPANILLVDYVGDPDFVKLLDFGVAVHAESPRLTSNGQPTGTPQYMAPEQVMAARIDARADLYALGLVLAEALTGTRVFTADTAMAICFAQASPQPAPLSPAVVTGPLGDVIVKATAKQPSERFATAHDMLAMVERGPVGNVRLPPQPPTPVVVARKNPVAPVLITLALAAAAMGTTLAIWRPWEHPTSPALEPIAREPAARPEPKPVTTGALINVDEARLRQRAEQLGWTIKETTRTQFPSCDHTRLQLQRGDLAKRTYRWGEIYNLDCISPEVAASELRRLRSGFPGTWYILDNARILSFATPPEGEHFAKEASSKQLADALLVP